MKIVDTFAKKETVYSFEVFPPKKTSQIDTIYNTLDELSTLSPDYISVTYGAGGNKADHSTCDIASIIKNKYNIEPLAHLTCINNSKSDMDEMLTLLSDNNIENILVLRGDRNPDVEEQKDFLHASDLASYITSKGNFAVAGACYPEGHNECDDMVTDVLNLKKKVDAGANHLISQLFFDNEQFYSFAEKTKIAGINVPISAGIMPVISTNQIGRIVSMCGVSFPKKFARICSRYENNPEAMRDAGIAYAVDQIIDLVANGVEGIHLYTMNNPYVARRITESIKSIVNLSK